MATNKGLIVYLRCMMFEVVIAEAMSVGQRIVALDTQFNLVRPLPSQYSQCIYYSGCVD